MVTYVQLGIRFMFINHSHFWFMDVGGRCMTCSLLSLILYPTTGRSNMLPLGCLKLMKPMAWLWLLNFNNFLKFSFSHKIFTNDVIHWMGEHEHGSMWANKIFRYIFRIFFPSRWNILCILKTLDRIILLLENGFRE
jgi:hypothetical protein